MTTRNHGRMRDAVIVIAALIFIAAFLGTFLLPVQRFWLHGPGSEAVVRIDAEAGGMWRKPSSAVVEQTVYYYVIVMPDGTLEHIAFPQRFAVGSEVRIGFTRGSLTGTVFISAVEAVP